MNPVNLETINQAAGLKPDLSTLPGIITAFVKIALPLAGIILLFVIIFSGFTILTNPNNPDKVQKGQKMLTQGIFGFVIVFAAYWLAQILEVLTGFPIVSQ